MEKAKWMIIAMLLFTQARAQVISNDERQDKTAKQSFKSVYETNQYFNDLEESIELKYANLKVPIFERMEGPQDSLWLIDEQINTLREMIRLEELGFIEWDKQADKTLPTYQKEKTDKQEAAHNEIVKMRKLIDELETEKPLYLRDLRSQELILDKIDREKDRELEQARSERQSALARMYRA